MMRGVQHIHFVGIGGAGMSGIADILHAQGYQVSGSDHNDSITLQQLAARGIRTFVGHVGAQVAGADVVVTSSAVAADNAEVLHAKALQIPVVQRAQMLAELMRSKQGIAVAGTHGKTTTTSLLTSVLVQAGLDPSFVIGARLRSAGTAARLGRGEYLVAEADESDASFVHLLPVLAIVTNIDADHMQTYGQDFGRLQQAFVDFLHRLPFYGTAVLCSDDVALSAIASQVHCRVSTYGLGADAQVRAVDVRAVSGQMHFRVQRGTLPTLDIVLNLCGEHNVRNALAAIAVAMTLGIPDAAVQKALRAFDGVERRFERYGEHHLPTGGSMAVVDDYGHHPTEIAATLAAARGAFAGRRLVLAFQPHRYTRTQDCFADFVSVLALADAVLLAEVYGAGEAPIAGADSSALGQALQASSGSAPAFVGAVADMAAAAIAKARDGDVLLCMGAGSIGALAGQVVARLRATQQAQAVA